MKEYHKILTVYKRDPATKHRTLLEGEYASPEFAYLQGNRWLYTEKINGTNIRVDWNPEEKRVRYGGRTDNSQIFTFFIEKLQDILNLGIFSALYLDTPMTLYGEGYGAKIQKGGGNYIPDGCGFILFDVKVGDVWLERHNVEDIASKLSLPVVPIVGTGTLQEAVEMVQEGFESQIAAVVGTKAEGLVMRPEVVLFDRMGKRVITKIKAKDFRK